MGFDPSQNFATQPPPDTTALPEKNMGDVFDFGWGGHNHSQINHSGGETWEVREDTKGMEQDAAASITDGWLVDF